jgi:hypothetical protein
MAVRNIGVQAAVLAGAIAFGAVAVPLAPAVAKTITDVFVTNDATHPVPTQAQGTTQVAGTVNVGNTPAVTVSGTPTVNVAGDPATREPYQQSVFFAQTADNCTQFACPARFPVVPAGKLLMVTFAGAQFDAGGVARVRLQRGDGFEEVGVILPAPVAIDVDTFVVGSPVTFTAEAGTVPTMMILGSSMQAGNPAVLASLAGYLVPVP